MKNVFISFFFLLFLGFGTTSEAQTNGLISCPNKISMTIHNNTCLNGNMRRIIFGATSSQSNAEVEIYYNGNLVAQGYNASEVFYFPTRSYPYTVYVECVSNCRRDGCIVVIEPC